MIRIIKTWWKWRKDWDSLCNQCGKCCYRRDVNDDGVVLINYAAPCEFLDVNTHKCTVYYERFQKCKFCRKVNMWIVLFNRTLPNDCAYRLTFRRH